MLNEHHKYKPENLYWSERYGVVNAYEKDEWMHYVGTYTMGYSTKESFHREYKPIGVKKEVTQDVLDHCWKMYQQGQISADHTAKEVFEQTLQSFAKWLVD